jgi:hypothetical protein
LPRIEHWYLIATMVSVRRRTGSDFSQLSRPPRLSLYWVKIQ